MAYVSRALRAIAPKTRLRFAANNAILPTVLKELDTNGKPDFRVMDTRKYQLALDKRRCWLCGQPLGKYATFVAGLPLV